MSLVHVLLEVDGGYFELTIDGMYYIPKEEALESLPTPDVSLMFNITNEEYEALYAKAELLFESNAKISVCDLLRVMFRQKPKGFVCTDMVLFLLSVVTQGFTAYQLFDVMVSEADEVRVKI